MTPDKNYYELYTDYITLYYTLHKCDVKPKKIETKCLLALKFDIAQAGNHDEIISMIQFIGLELFYSFK